ncbi:hypothetical protein WQ54_00890 [Bacillus sp. SA1-12]|uniref:CD3324 family protein n=1 Tax=Bacillus sp. SA1-12 TaxID=1455638 RepID=UPI0006261AE5|nr:CD3324 family protein [Bacillus sp. SA1-12]KKI94126.1 hypothetical protein WQ54_00890 [Bacillus sp. SA1-12]
MKYVNANHVLPEELIKEIQKYVQGETVYIPKPKRNHQKWGSNSGSRQLIDDRNTKIKNSFKNGNAIDQLADEFFLSIETIKKIVY